MLQSVNGSIPSELAGLAKLQKLGLPRNQLTGTIPPQLGTLSNLRGFYVSDNQLTGTIPPELGSLTNLESLSLYSNQLTGAIPPQLANLVKLQALYLFSNRLTGVIPRKLGNLVNLRWLVLSSNQLSGTIPTEIGNLIELTMLGVADNAFEGEIPSTIVNLTKLNATANDFTDLGHNKLVASNPTVVTFLNVKDPDWAQTQTVPPAFLIAAPGPVNTIDLGWPPIPYTADGGYYEVGFSETPGGPYNIRNQTANKSASTYTVKNLRPGKTYYFAVRTYTPAHGDQQNNL